ncbi:MAG: Ig-like domain-containing protein [Anaerolineales bacterium]
MSPPKNKIIPLLATAIFLLTAISLACNLPAGLQERFFGLETTPTITPEPTFTPQPLPPTIVETDPPLGSTINVGGPITLYFNQKMDKASVEDALSGDPELAGLLTWSDPATLIYTPDQPLPPNTTLVLQVDTTAKAANGLALTEPVQVNFFTPDTLQATHFLPSPGAIEIDPASAVVVTFNQPVVSLGESLSGDPAFTINPSAAGKGEWINTSTYLFSPETALAGGVTYKVELSSLLTSTAGAALDPETTRSWTFSTSYPQLLDWSPYEGAKNIPLDTSLKLTFNQAMDTESVAANLKLISGAGKLVTGEFVWTDDLTEAVFTPDQLLDRATTYAAVLPGETKAAGNTPLQLDTNWQFETAGEFSFYGTPAGQNNTFSVYEGATLYFNSPVDLDNFEENISFTPEVSNLRPSAGGSENVLHIYGNFEPLTNYNLAVKQALSDIWGSSLKGSLSLFFTTESLPSNLVITQGSNILFLTGTENTIPADGTNLYQVSVNIGTIPLEAYSNFFGPNRYSALDEYYPADLQRWTHIVNVPGDDNYPVNLPLNQAGTSLAPGLYRYQIYSQDLPYNPSPYLLAVSNVHLTMKASPQNLLVWAVDLETRAPVKGAEISIYNSGGEVLYKGETNQQGVYEVEFGGTVDLYSRIFYAVAGDPGEENFGITASNWAYGTEPYNFSLRANYSPPQPQTYIYTDRPMYRPGQTVYYRLVHRINSDGDYKLPVEDEINLTIDLPQGEDQEVTLPLSEYGTAHGEYQLSSFAQPGYYQLETDDGMVFFQVAEYRKPEIDLQVSFGKEETLLDDDWQGTVDAQYYFDAPAGDLPISWTLRAVRSHFSLPGYQVGVLGSNWFTYPGLDYAYMWGSLIDSGEDETDARGAWTIERPLANVDADDWEITLPATYKLMVTAQDETGFQITNQAEMMVHPSDFYIGVKPSSWITKAEEEVRFEIKVVDWEKETDGVRNLRAVLNRVTWQSEAGEFGQITYQREAEEIATENFSTGRDGEKVISFSPPEPGTYQLDVYGDGALTEVMLWVGGPGTTAWPTLTNQKIRLVADQDTYLPGEDAEIFIPNPFPGGALALITIERHKIVSYQTLNLTSSGETISIPLSDEESPNIYVSVTLLGQDEDGTADFRQGYINLLVEPVKKAMQVEVIGKPERLGPREEVQFTIRVSDHNGEPLEGEFTLAVVDKAVLALADPNSPEIGEAFYGVQPLAVQMGIPLGMHAGRSIFIPGGMGGGGGAEAYFVRSQFEDTGYWSADILTDEKGEAVVTVTMPDNLTTWQAEARGVTKETEVGQAAVEVVTTKDLLIRPVTPRFLVAGDHLALAAVVHNNTNGELTAVVTLQGTGIQLDIPDYSTQSVDIPAGGRTRVEWWGTVEDIDEVDLTFTADAGECSDAVKPYLGALPVSRYTAPQTFGTSGVLEDSGQLLEIVTLPKTYDPEEGSLEIELSPSLAAALLTALDAMEDDQHVSTIAILSHFLPNIITYQSLQELELEFPKLESRLESIIPETLAALSAAQNEDGGWGWRQGSASDGEISSFILFGLSQAERAGVFVEDLMIQQARGYLLATLPAVDMLAEPWQYNQLAFRYFSLTEAGIDTSGGMLELASLSSQLSPYAQAVLALALENQLPGNEQARTLFSNLVGTGIRTSTGIHWENPENCRCWLNNTTTTTAIVTYALARADADSGTLPEAVRYLVSASGPGGDWGSAYETGWAVLALNEVMKTQGDLLTSFEYSSAVNGTEIINGQAEGPTQLEAVTASIPVGALYAEDPNALVINRGDGDGTLYYKAHLLVSRPAEDVPPFGKGISISRVYADFNNEDAPIFTQEGTSGALVQVQLTLVLENDAHYLIVEDRIPAGAEILDTRLKTTRQDTAEYLVSAPFRNGWGWWYFNPPTVFDDRVTWSVSYLPAGTYQLTYSISLTHPGEYQVLPARGWEVYFPETQAISAGEKFVIHPED